MRRPLNPAKDRLFIVENGTGGGENFTPRSKLFPNILRLMFGAVLLAGASGAYAAVCTARAAGGNWNAAGTWLATGGCAGVPANADDVVIPAGSPVTLNANSNNLASLNVAGTLTIGNNTTARTLTVSGSVTVTGTVQVDNPGSATNHTLTLGGDVSNTGTFNMSTANGKGNITFNRNGNQTVSGAGAYTFNLITVNMGATNANILDMQSIFTEPVGFLTITNGTYRHSNTSAITPWIADPNIPASGRFWLNANATVSTGNFNVTLNGGALRIDAGTMNVGTANANVLQLGNFATTSLIVNGGALNATGGIISTNAAGAGTFTQTAGTISVSTMNPPGTNESFMLGSGTTFNMSGGTIIAVEGNANPNDDINIRSGTQNVTGGTLQIGSAATVGPNIFLITNTTGAAFSVWNLRLASGIAKVTQLDSPINVLNDLTIQAGNTLQANAAGDTITIGGGNASGNWTNNGTFTNGGSTVTFTGTSAAPAIGGTSATTFNNFTINKATNNLAINTTPTINGTLTFTSGDIVTGANRVILGTAAIVATPSAASYVVGTVQKNYSVAGTLTFPVGDANNYTPVTVQGTAGFTAGNLSINTTGNDHPQVTTPIPSTGIDANKSVNRFWTLTAGGLPAASTYNATFNFINASPVDLDAGVTQTAFIVERYDGTVWNPTTLGVAGANSTSITGVANVYGAFAIGEQRVAVPGLGRFNAFETSTAANALLGSIYTKLASVAFSLDVVSVNAARTGYGGAVANVTVELLNSSNNAGVLDANGCRPTWTVVQTITATLNIPAGGRVTLGGITVPQAYRDARLRMSAGALIGCSTDRFSVRPPSFTVTSTNAGNTNTTGAPAIRTGANFNLTAASVAGYDGTPSIDNTRVVGTPTAGAIGGSFGAAPVGTGTATGATFFYSEVGNFGLNANAVYDSSFTAVDQPADCTADFSSALVGGRYGCSFGSAAVAQTTGVSGFGRFIPDNFNVSFNVPQFATGCGTFTYVGRAFTYATAPVMTVTARNGTNNGLTNATTVNYAGAYMKLSNAAGTSLNQAPYNFQGGRYTRFDALGGGSTPVLDATGLPATTADPTIGAFAAGVGTLTFAPGTGLTFTRTAPNAVFNADIELALNVVDTDGVAYASNPARFGQATAGNGIAFNGGKPMRCGRLVVLNAFGSELIALPVPMRAQYYVDNSTGFVTNTQDNCTSITTANLDLANGIQNPPLGTATITINSGPPAHTTTASIANSPLTSGDAGLVFSAPTFTSSTEVRDGYTDVRVDLAALPWLRYDWDGNGVHDDDPTARATFGIFRGNRRQIFTRERY